MKNIRIKSYLMALATLFLVFACDNDPLKDDIERIVATTSVQKEVTYTLTDDDYDTADDFCSCSGFGNFSRQL